MSNNLPLMPEDLMREFKITPEHPYYQEIQCLLSMAFIIEQTGVALVQAPYQSKQLDAALINALDDYIEKLSELSSKVYKKVE